MFKAQISETTPANGCELSGRGSIPHKPFQVPTCRFSLASAAASPARSSELLAGGLNSVDPLKEFLYRTYEFLVTGLPKFMSGFEEFNDFYVGQILFILCREFG